MVTWPEQGSCYIIGEIGMAHDGSLGMAHAYIDAVARAGAHAVKFQTHIAEEESTAAEPFRVSLSGQDGSRLAYWRRTAFNEKSWIELVDHAHSVGLCFISSPFSEAAVDLLVRVGADVLKIASGEVGNLPLLIHSAKSGLPVMVSSGMSSLAEIDNAVKILEAQAVRFAVFQCTSAYPCPPERIGLNLITDFQKRYQCPVGLSDHSGTIYAGLAAATLGAAMVEVHVCFSKEMYGPDVPASLTPNDLARLVEGATFVGRAVACHVYKDYEAEKTADLRKIFTKSIVARTSLPAGARLALTDLAFKKPGTGIPAARYEELLNRKLRHDVEQDHFFSLTDFED
jgi:N,N'-diacetyllegionaminate synthase